MRHATIIIIVVDSDHRSLMYGVIIARDSLECHDDPDVEFDYYTTRTSIRRLICMNPPTSARILRYNNTLGAMV